MDRLTKVLSFTHIHMVPNLYDVLWNIKEDTEDIKTAAYFIVTFNFLEATIKLIDKLTK